MKECKTHKWIPVSEGHGLFHDECEHCGVMGYLDFETGQIKAKPMAKVISLCEYRKKRETKNAVGEN